jgi:two-component system CheB/CheR fusion protein
MQSDRSRKSREPARRARTQPTETARSTPPKPEGSPRGSGFPIVGIGASAGGVAVVSELIKALPANPGMAFIVVMHLHPKGGSVLDTLLAPMTPLPVRQAQDGDVIEANCVYVIPAAKYLTVRDGRLHTVIHRIHRHKTTGAIDRLFVSLAKDAGKRARGVVLSGTGNDGSEGLRRIHENGGLSFVQDPGSAQFREMPDSAIATGVANFVLSPAVIALQLTQKSPASLLRTQKKWMPKPMRSPQSLRRWRSAPASTTASTKAPPCSAASRGAWLKKASRIPRPICIICMPTPTRRVSCLRHC